MNPYCGNHFSRTSRSYKNRSIERAWAISNQKAYSDAACVSISLLEWQWNFVLGLYFLFFSLFLDMVVHENEFETKEKPLRVREFRWVYLQNRRSRFFRKSTVHVALILVTSQSSKVFLELFENIFAVRMIWVTLQRFTYRSVAALKVADLQTPKIRRSLLGLVC